MQAMSDNTSNINPTGYMVLVKVDAVETKTAGGIFLPQQHIDREQTSCQVGVLVAKGPCAGTHLDWPEGYEFPSVGARVVTRKFANQYDLKGDDGSEYRLCEDKDILAILGS